MAEIPADVPSTVRLPKTSSEKQDARRVVVLLQQASLETVKTKKGFELLNCDEHQGLQWVRAEEAWKRKLELVNELKGSKQLLEHMKENKAGVDVWIRVLQKAGFLDSEESTKLTTKGVLASWTRGAADAVASRKAGTT